MRPSSASRNVRRSVRPLCVELTRAVEALGADASNIAILFVSLDPERDTPEALSDFVAPSAAA